MNSTPEPWSQPFIDSVNLRCHQILASRLGENPEVRTTALENVERWLDENAYPPGPSSQLQAWRAVLAESSDTELSRFMTDPSEAGNLRRSNSPFAGILSGEERLGVVESLEQAA